MPADPCNPFDELVQIRGAGGAPLDRRDFLKAGGAAAAGGALAGWRPGAEHPMASRASVGTARLVARSCEGIIASLGRR